MSNQGMSIKKSRLHFAAVIVLFVALLTIPAQAAEIYGQKWNDLDGDAVKDPNEPGVPNIWIGLFPHGPIIIEPGDPEPYSAATLTDPEGNYSFMNVPGNTHNIPAYEIAEDIPFDWIQTYPGYVCPNCSLQYSHIVSVANDTIITGLNFGNRQLTPPPPDVTVVNQSGEQNGIPTVYRPTLSDLVIQKNLSSYDIVSVNLTMIWMMTWSGGTITKTASMAEIDATGVWEAIILQPIPAGTATMTFEVDVTPSGPGPEDLIEYGDIIFVDPSGTIRDACTNTPINGAIVTLYVYDSTLDLFVPCPSEMILGSTSNTQITGIDGEYAWMTAPGIYKVSAVMAGYETGWSDPVTVPPPKTGVDIYLGPCGGITTYPLDIELTQIQIFPHGADKVQIQGTITLDSTNDGIDPVIDGFNLRLFLPTGLPGSNQFYPTKNDIMPVYFQAISGGWSINASEKSRTGIQDLKILETPDPAIFTFILVDTKSALMTDDYQDIIIDIYSGNDVGITDVRLRENNNKYTL